MNPISHPDLWLCTLYLLPTQSPACSPPPPPSSSRPWSTSQLFPARRFSSDLVSHYLSEIKTTVPRIPRNLRSLRRGVRQTVVPVVCSSEAGWCVFWFSILLQAVCRPSVDNNNLDFYSHNEHKKHSFSFDLDRLTTFVLDWWIHRAHTLSFDLRNLQTP